MRTSIEMHECNMAERTVDLLHIPHRTGLVTKACDEPADTFMEFPTFRFRKADQLLWDVPEIADKGGDECKGFIAFLFMPRHTERGDLSEHLIMIIIVTVFSVDEGAVRCRRSERLEVVLILRYWAHSFSIPDIHNRIRDHARIAASTRRAKRMGMVDIEVPWATLEHQPGFMRRDDGASPVELCDVEGAGLSTRWCQSYL